MRTAQGGKSVGVTGFSGRLRILFGLLEPCWKRVVLSRVRRSVCGSVLGAITGKARDR